MSRQRFSQGLGFGNYKRSRPRPEDPNFKSRGSKSRGSKSCGESRENSNHPNGYPNGRAPRGRKHGDQSKQSKHMAYDPMNRANHVVQANQMNRVNHVRDENVLFKYACPLADSPNSARSEMIHKNSKNPYLKNRYCGICFSRNFTDHANGTHVVVIHAMDNCKGKTVKCMFCNYHCIESIFKTVHLNFNCKNPCIFKLHCQACSTVLDTSKDYQNARLEQFHSATSKVGWICDIQTQDLHLKRCPKQVHCSHCKELVFTGTACGQYHIGVQCPTTAAIVCGVSHSGRIGSSHFHAAYRWVHVLTCSDHHTEQVFDSNATADQMYINVPQERFEITNAYDSKQGIFMFDPCMSECKSCKKYCGLFHFGHSFARKSELACLVHFKDETYRQMIPFLNFIQPTRSSELVFDLTVANEQDKNKASQFCIGSFILDFQRKKLKTYFIPGWKLAQLGCLLMDIYYLKINSGHIYIRDVSTHLEHYAMRLVQYLAVRDDNAPFSFQNMSDAPIAFLSSDASNKRSNMPIIPIKPIKHDKNVDCKHVESETFDSARSNDIRSTYGLVFPERGRKCLVECWDNPMIEDIFDLTFELPLNVINDKVQAMFEEFDERSLRKALFWVKTCHANSTLSLQPAPVATSLNDTSNLRMPFMSKIFPNELLKLVQYYHIDICPSLEFNEVRDPDITCLDCKLATCNAMSRCEAWLVCPFCKVFVHNSDHKRHVEHLCGFMMECETCHQKVANFHDMCLSCEQLSEMGYYTKFSRTSIYTCQPLMWKAIYNNYTTSRDKHRH